MACRERNCDRRKEEVGFGRLEPLLSRPGPAFARTRHARHMDGLLTASPDRPPLAGNRHIIRPPAWVKAEGLLGFMPRRVEHGADIPYSAKWRRHDSRSNGTLESRWGSSFRPGE